MQKGPNCLRLLTDGSNLFDQSVFDNINLMYFQANILGMRLILLYFFFINFFLFSFFKSLPYQMKGGR